MVFLIIFTLPPGFSNFTAGLSAFVVVKPNVSTAWSNFFNLGGGHPNLYNDAICFSRNDITPGLWFQVVVNGADSYMSGGTISKFNLSDPRPAT